MIETPDFRNMDARDRIACCIPGDPVSDYRGFPDIQLEIIAEERHETETATVHKIGTVAVHEPGLSSRGPSLL